MIKIEVISLARLRHYESTSWHQEKHWNDVEQCVILL